jgi:hypothetical protein
VAIHILDDSTDATTALAARLVAQYRLDGYNITYDTGSIARATKRGHCRKGAGVLPLESLSPFLTPFFHHRLLAHPPVLSRPRWPWCDAVGTREPEFLLTRAQSLGIDGHFWVEQAARCWSGLFMNFNGSGGIWRRQAIDDAGGWQADTLTEDLDLSYRAQLRGWRLHFVPQVVCPAEVPVQMSGVKSQQHRWAKGSIQVAKKLLPRIIRADLPVFTKYQAILHLTNYLVHPSCFDRARPTLPSRCRLASALCMSCRWWAWS